MNSNILFVKDLVDKIYIWAVDKNQWFYFKVYLRDTCSFEIDKFEKITFDIFGKVLIFCPSILEDERFFTQGPYNIDYPEILKQYLIFI